MEAIEFYKNAFGANELLKLTMPDGKIAYAELQINESILMLADEFPEHNAFSPHSLGGTATRVFLYVEDVDSTIKQATEFGAKLIKPIEDQFFGDRLGVIEDPFGHWWSIATKNQPLPRAVIADRFNKLMQQ